MTPPIVLRSTLLTSHGFRHGFTTRLGGVSGPPFESLNCARSVGDAPEAVEENLRRVAEAVGFRTGGLFELSQVHGAAVAEVRGAEDPMTLRAQEGDALVTVSPDGVAVGVRTADCVPVLVADPRSRLVAAVHAGWRGVVAGVVPAAVRRLVALAGTPTEELHVALGPHIRADAFEVGPEVTAALVAASGDPLVAVETHVRPHADLARAVRAQLGRLGVRHIDDVGGCTHADSARFYSFRRDGQRSGRHLAVIVSG